MYISRHTGKILGTQQKMLGAQLKILGAQLCSNRKAELKTLLHHFQFFAFYFDPVFVVLTKADLLFI